MGIFDSSERARSRRRVPASEASDTGDGVHARWRAEGKFYEFTGVSQEGVGHPSTITVYADRVTTTPGHRSAAASEGVSRLPVRGAWVAEAPLRAVTGVLIHKATVTLARISVEAPPQALSIWCVRTVAEQVRRDLEAAIGEAMVAAARRAVPEAPVPAVADVIAADDPARLLEQLADLRDRGLITGPEFDARKRQILGR